MAAIGSETRRSVLRTMKPIIASDVDGYLPVSYVNEDRQQFPPFFAATDAPQNQHITRVDPPRNKGDQLA